MQVHLPERTVVDSTHLVTARFHIPASAMGKVAHSVISGLYSDSTRFVYEITANAVDANPAGVKVTLPTPFSGDFVVEDQGLGMSREFMLGGKFTEIFGSTKDQDDAHIGGHGVGRLSPLGVTDCYHVETRGCTYMVRKDREGVPEIAYVGPSNVCGTRVTVPVPPGKVAEVVTAARAALRWYDPPVACNLEIPRPEILFGSPSLGWAWRQYGRDDKPLLVMGGYPYPLVLDDGYRWNGLVLFAGPGFASVTVNRQSLLYDDRTKANIKAAVDKMRDDLGLQVEREIAACATVFAAKRKLKEAINQLPVRPRGVTYRGQSLTPTIDTHCWVAEVGRRSRDVRKLGAAPPDYVDVPERLFVYDGPVPPKGTVGRLNHAGYAKGVVLLRTVDADLLEVPASARVKVEDLSKPPPSDRGSSSPAKWWQLSPGRSTFGDFHPRPSQLPAHAYYVPFEKGEPVREVASLLQGFAAFPHELYGVPKSAKVPAGWTEFTPALIRTHVEQELSKLGDVGRLLAIGAAWQEVPTILQRVIDKDVSSGGGPKSYRRLRELRPVSDLDPRAINDKLTRVGLPTLTLPKLKPNDDPKALADKVMEARPMLKLLGRLYPDQDQLDIIAGYLA